jgi:carboxymethylenebutenolidase
MPARELTRRDFIVTGAAATGYALAAGPISAGTIHTDSKGLVAGEVKIPVEGKTIPAYRARPEAKGDPPTVLVVHEIFGVHEYIRDICRRFAKQGYLAVAPDLYSRQGDPEKAADIRTLIREIVSRVSDERVLADLDATADWIEKVGEGDTERMGITGFCWGGRVVWLYAAHSAKLRAGAAWYGRLVGDERPETRRHPVDLAADLRAPVLGLYGDEDRGIPLDTVERMREAIRSAGRESEIVVYTGASHGFHADYRQSYHRAAAEDGWRRMLEWFRKHGAV